MYSFVFQYSKETEKFLDVQRGSRTETEVQWSAGAATGGGAR